MTINERKDSFARKVWTNVPGTDFIGIYSKTSLYEQHAKIKIPGKFADISEKVHFESVLVQNI